MKKITFTVLSCFITVCLSAQTDTAQKKVFPPDIVIQHDNEIQNSTKPDSAMPAKKVINTKSPKKSTHSALVATPKNCITMREGVVMVVKDGAAGKLESDMTLTNGTIVKVNGTMVKSNGAKMMMRDGDYIDMAGKLTRVKK